MKEISKKAILSAIKSEYADGKEFVSRTSGGYFKMVIDTSDGSIWSDVFADENSYKIYHSDTVQDLERDWSGNVIKEYYQDAIQKLKAAGWTITE